MRAYSALFFLCVGALVVVTLMANALEQRARIMEQRAEEAQRPTLNPQ